MYSLQTGKENLVLTRNSLQKQPPLLMIPYREEDTKKQSLHRCKDCSEVSIETNIYNTKKLPEIIFE